MWKPPVGRIARRIVDLVCRFRTRYIKRRFIEVEPEEVFLIATAIRCRLSHRNVFRENGRWFFGLTPYNWSRFRKRLHTLTNACEPLYKLDADIRKLLGLESGVLTREPQRLARPEFFSDEDMNLGEETACEPGEDKQNQARSLEPVLAHNDGSQW